MTQSSSASVVALHRRYHFIEQREHSRMAPYVIDIDERGAAVKWSHSADSEIVRPTIIVGDLVSRCNQGAQGATPLCPAIRWTDCKEH
jgi:hypothetical protein